ncbi:MAG: VWA domain-containing protein [Parabacteroides sp.]|nr:VWA domain-containing protein [Parabacteroides sp.]
MKLFILLDTSGSMEGAKIGSLNDCMSNIIIDLQEKAFNGSAIEMAVLSFSREISWMYEKPKSVLDFEWKELSASGMTPLGQACIELSNHITNYSDINQDNIIILLSDGCPTDDYEEGISVLKSNAVFIQSKRYAIALGEDADYNGLFTFTESKENIFEISNSNLLFDILQSLVTTNHDMKNDNLGNIIDPDDEWS